MYLALMIESGEISDEAQLYELVSIRDALLPILAHMAVVTSSRLVVGDARVVDALLWLDQQQPQTSI